MDNQSNIYQVGDQIVHRSYGTGVIIDMEEKVLSGRARSYYVVQMRDLMLWVPINETGPSSLRFPTPVRDFQKMFQILTSPGEPLSPDRFARKTQLTLLLRDGTLESICRVIRDLAYFRREKKMNDYDGAILERASSFLVDEWSTALNLPALEVEQKLKVLLDEV